MKALQSKLDRIRAETDQNRKNLLVAELVTELFRNAGAEAVVVGGSAVEFYTDGAYVSGDIDICFEGPHLPRPRERETVLAAAGESIGIRQWKICEVMVDLLGRLESSARGPLQTLGCLSSFRLKT